jgi:mannose/cellobiose epimerase-like protein (N-acyl-D-glucosamine 2-epimerase family)
LEKRDNREWPAVELLKTAVAVRSVIILVELAD